MPDRDDYDAHDDPGWLRDRLRQRDRLIDNLRREQDEATDLIRRFDEYVEDYNATLERWREAFDMVLTDGGWSWKPFWDEHYDLVNRYISLVRNWNRAVPVLNAGLQDVGRPLAASDAQVATVTKLHKAGKSLRGIDDQPQPAHRPHHRRSQDRHGSHH